MSTEVTRRRLRRYRRTQQTITRSVFVGVVAEACYVNASRCDHIRVASSGAGLQRVDEETSVRSVPSRGE